MIRQTLFQQHPAFKAPERCLAPALASVLGAEATAAYLVHPWGDALTNTINDFRTLQPQWRVVAIPEAEKLPFERVAQTQRASAEMMSALYQLHNPTAYTLFLIPAAQLMSMVPSPRRIYEKSLRIDQSNFAEYSARDFSRKLLELGYSSCREVREAGYFAHKGAIVDVFSALYPHPIRAEFHSGQALHSEQGLSPGQVSPGQRLSNGQLHRLKFFDRESQRSITVTHEVVIPPAHNIGLVDQQNRKALLKEFITTQCALHETPTREKNALLSLLDEELWRSELEEFIPGLIPQHAMHQLLGERIVVVDPEKTSHMAEERLSFAQERYETLKAEHYALAKFSTRFDATSELFAPTCSLHLKEAGGERLPLEDLGSLRLELLSKYRKQRSFAPLAEFLNSGLAKGESFVFFASNEFRHRKLQELLEDLDETFAERTIDLTEFDPEKLTQLGKGEIAITQGHLSHTFRDNKTALTYFSDADLLGDPARRAQAISGTTDARSTLTSLSRLEVGELVVHRNFGIGRYLGLEQRTFDGISCELLKIEYADSILFLPIYSVSLIHPYDVLEGRVPQLDKLGTGSWAKRTGKVKKSILALAGDLMKLYAARELAEGIQFSEPGYEDEAFALDFPFQETPDQQRAIVDVLADMIKPQPMDRLVCGDVGFGKTEVALRAIFRCIRDGFQAAVLCPTTILTEQHHETLLNRLKPYGIAVRGYSRFRSSSENRETKECLADGSLDVVVGTHKLLGRGIEFKNLGLLVIDEEHRFGVKDKERIKQLKSSIDVLTLTATPIPRSLHMSLLGLRNLSTIETPPPGRMPVKTFFARRGDGIIRDAIMRELGRNGQAFFLHNRVRSLPAVLSDLKEIVPEARCEIAHGQMREKELEDIMRRFIAHEFDVLICTTIIESGIDIPNANTILIDRADSLGLAALYQLRGRVGRSTRQGYCYLLTPDQSKLGAMARERLRALESLEDLGVGYHLALRDLEIRGAGNLLGKEQTGHIFEIGYELFCAMIEDAVRELQGVAPDNLKLIEPELVIPFEGYLPEFYAPHIADRLSLYQRLATVRERQQFQMLRDELEDRFGPPPAPVTDLFTIMELRLLLKENGVEKLEYSTERLALTLSPNNSLHPTTLDRILSGKSLLRIGSNNRLIVEFPKDSEALTLEGLGLFCDSLLQRLSSGDIHDKFLIASFPTRSPQV